MRKGRIFFMLALILLLGLVAVGVVWYKFSQPPSAEQTSEVQPTPVIDLVKVVVVTQKVPRGSVLNEEVISLIDIPREVFIDGYYTDFESVVGRQARIDIEPNMLLTRNMVVESSDQLSSTGSLAALSIPRGMVAVSIPINRLSSVSYAPQPGDHVNVIASLLLVDLDPDFQTILPNQNAAVLGAGPGVVTGSPGEGGEGSAATNADLEKVTAQLLAAGQASVVGRTEIDPLLEQTFYIVPSEAQRPRLVSQTLLQDAIVLGVGEFPLAEGQKQQPDTSSPETDQPVEGAPPEDVTNGGEGSTVAPKLPDLITLIVTPQDAVTLNYLIYSGAQLTLALRSAGDDSRVQTEAATLDFLLKQYNVPVPVKLPYGLQPRIDQLAPPQLQNDKTAPIEQ